MALYILGAKLRKRPTPRTMNEQDKKLTLGNLGRKSYILSLFSVSRYQFDNMGLPVYVLAVWVYMSVFLRVPVMHCLESWFRVLEAVDTTEGSN